jgi:hypothetical protein
MEFCATAPPRRHVTIKPPARRAGQQAHHAAASIAGTDHVLGARTTVEKDEDEGCGITAPSTNQGQPPASASGNFKVPHRTGSSSVTSHASLGCEHQHVG